MKRISEDLGYTFCKGKCSPGERTLVSRLCIRSFSATERTADIRLVAVDLLIPKVAISIS